MPLRSAQANADRVRGIGRRERNLSRAYGRLLVLLARMQNKSPEAIAAKSEGSGYRPDLIIGMRTGNILAATAERFVAVTSLPATVGRTLRLCFIPSQLRDAANV